MSNGHVGSESPLSMFAASLAGSSSSSEMVAADAQAALANALVDSLVQVNAKGLREIVFLSEYLGPEQAMQFLGVWKEYKRHQIPGALKRLVEAIKALSLSEFMRGVNLNLGQK